MRQLISSKLLFFLITSLTILSLNLTPLVLQIRHTPPGRTHALIHNNAQDYYFYLSLMNRGANGDWLTRDPYTTEPSEPSIIFSYFVWLGKVSHLFNLPFSWTYHLVRITASVILLFTVYRLVFALKVPYPRLAFLFFFFASPLMHTINDNGKIISVPFMNWWTAMDPIRRISYLPHHMIGNVLLVTTLFLLLRFMRKPNGKILLSVAGIFLILSFIHPPSLFLLLLIIPTSIILTHFFQLFFFKNKKLFIRKHIPSQLLTKHIFLLFLCIILGGIFLLIMVSQTGKGFPWTQYIEWEKKLQFPLEFELIGALGILFPLAILGIISSFLSKQFEKILVACWLTVPILFIPIAPKLQISNIRLVQGVPYLPLAILATFGLKVIGDILVKIFNSSKIKAQSAKPSSKFKTVLNSTLGSDLCTLNSTLTVITLIIFSLFTYPTLSWSLRDQIREYWPIFGNIYLDNRLTSAFTFINTSFPKDAKTIATFYTGNYLPAFTHTKSYIGHFGYTYNIDQKQKEVRKFFENKMREKEAKDFLLSNKIDLIFQGPEEKPIYSAYLYPTLLKPIYDKEEVTIYKIQEKF